MILFFKFMQNEGNKKLNQLNRQQISPEDKVPQVYL